MREGWQCPVCRTVYSPDVQQCMACSAVAPRVFPKPPTIPDPEWPGPQRPWRRRPSDPWLLPQYTMVCRGDEPLNIEWGATTTDV